MSIKVMTLVWDRYPGSGSDLLTMLALADWCNDAGGSLHPSIATVANKIRASESQARRIIHSFIHDGWLSVVGNAAGGKPGSSRHYQLNVRKLEELPVLVRNPTTGTDATPRVDDTPRTDASPTGRTDDTPPKGGGVAPMRETGVTHDTLTVIDPSKEQKPFSYDVAFEVSWAAYPRRAGGNNKREAFKAWKARLAHHNPSVLHDGVVRYANHVRAFGKEGTEYVKMASTFFGPNLHFLDDFPVAPPAKPASPMRAAIEDLNGGGHGDGEQLALSGAG